MWEDSFNFHQSSQRIAIECAFGELVQRWGILWSPMRHDLDQIGLIVQGLMCLHNICIDARMKDAVRCTEKGWADCGHPTLHLQEYFVEGALIETCVPVGNMSQGRRRDLEQCSRRELLTSKLKENLRVRPNHSAWGRASAALRATRAAAAEAAAS